MSNRGVIQIDNEQEVLMWYTRGTEEMPSFTKMVTFVSKAAF